jgi:hypothetical protein
MSISTHFSETSWIFSFFVVKISFRERPAMYKLKTTGLAGRKGVRLGLKAEAFLK